ncbi:hypothetical protein PINS_up006364 [Pythium insidiosum]|nr:hypothetical protein PINS_up006364 [Pythium insidiosum]
MRGFFRSVGHMCLNGRTSTSTSPGRACHVGFEHELRPVAATAEPALRAMSMEEARLTLERASMAPTFLGDDADYLAASQRQQEFVLFCGTEQASEYSPDHFRPTVSVDPDDAVMSLTNVHSIRPSLQHRALPVFFSPPPIPTIRKPQTPTSYTSTFEPFA